MRVITKAGKLGSICLAVGLCCISSSCVLDLESQTEFEGNLQSNIKNIVLIIGDGMGLNHIRAGELAAGRSFGFTDWQSVSVNTSSITADSALTITDSAAGATALATGNLTINGYVGKSFVGEDLKTIMDLAVEYGKSTGVVSTDDITGATPGGFSGHSLSRGNTEEIFLSQINSGINLMCAATGTQSIQYRDKLQAAGYSICRSYEKIEESMTADKAWWQFGMSGASAEVQLEDVAAHALDFLDRDEDGFVLMMEQAHIDKYSHSNDIGGMIKSMQSLNNTVEVVLDWLGDRKDTAILITADHETGGLSVSDEEVYVKRYVSEEGNTVHFKWATTAHTDSYVGLFTYGFSPDFAAQTYYNSNDLIKNIDIYNIMAELLESTN